ncbi:hypothetical protein CALVIDRAFT_31064 [Calocera viscosa TUFC12733]|uniref:F-box domain-containing protein n=1 Tax=Calocera viscosa (strain TUFC12733) TaxID=1330018 RepID=A0A167PDL5_CALVF|nr:hypothetical protein CALVIDRAFT_31064 [Calocera viscosa TUFC12733]
MDDKHALRSQIKKEIELLDVAQRRLEYKYQSASKPLDARYQRESGYIQASLKDAWTRLHAITGINTLPDELLLDIMQRVVWQSHGAPYNPHIRLRQLQCVCKHWMALCLGTAAFWTKFDLPLPTNGSSNIGLHVARLDNGFSKALTRSKGLPISLTVRPSNVDYNQTALRKILEIIRPSDVQVQSLKVNLTPIMVMTVAFALAQQFSRLEDLALVGETLPGSWRFPLALRTTTLKRLRANNLRLIVLDLPSSLSRVEALHFDNSTLLEGRRAAEDVEAWIYASGRYQDRGDFVLDAAVLQKLPNLRSLRIRNQAIAFPHSDVVSLAELRELSLVFTGGYGRQVFAEGPPFFQQVQFPKLKSLRVQSEQGTRSGTADQIIDSLHPIVAGVTSILLHRIIPSPEHLKMLLLRATDLKELDIGGGEISAELMRVLGDPMLKHLHTVKLTDIEKRSGAILEQMLSQPTEEGRQLSRRWHMRVVHSSRKGAGSTGT